MENIEGGMASLSKSAVGRFDSAVGWNENSPKSISFLLFSLNSDINWWWWRWKSMSLENVIF